MSKEFLYEKLTNEFGKQTISKIEIKILSMTMG